MLFRSLLAALRDRVSSPGQRAFTLDELKHRLTRADFLIERAGPEPSQAPGSKPVFEVRAIKKENLSTPVPQFSTGRELRAKQRPYPKGEELP